MTSIQTISERHAAAHRTLSAIGQEHVLHYFEQLDEAGRAKLLAQVESIDWPEVARLVESHVKRKPDLDLPANLEPAPWYPNVPAPEQQARYHDARALGEQLLRQGKVAAFTVAGGQGTRLGWDGPKGTYPATPIRKQSLFGCFAEYIRKLELKYRTSVPWYIMTSPINHDDTAAYFQEKNHFGLDPTQIMLFPQAMMPAFDMNTGQVLLEDRDSMALSPNGHGGSLKALHQCGAIADMKRRGIEQISYIQVDNPVVKVVDPLFIGLHAQDGAQMSSKMLPKAYPKEKLGNFCLVDGKVTVIEYSDLPDELAEQRVASASGGGGEGEGELRFRAGSIAIHAINVAFVDALNLGGSFALPFHRAEKKVPHLDLTTGRRVEPTEPNAVKLETFVFDALPICDTSIIYETDRLEEFAPIKNADGPGSVDCPSTSRKLQTERAAQWLSAYGVQAPRSAEGAVDATIEIMPLTAIEASDLADAKLPDHIDPGAEVLL